MCSRKSPRRSAFAGPRSWRSARGEVLAQSQPEEGVRLLDLAREGFELADDPVGALQAAIRATLARVHADQPERVRHILDDLIEPAYVRLAAADTDLGLPAWQDLQNWMAALTTVLPGPGSAWEPVPVSSLFQSSWEGWLVRLCACRIWREPATRSFQKYRDLDLVVAWYGGSAHLPLELRFALGESLETSQARGFPASKLSATGLPAASVPEDDFRERVPRRKIPLHPSDSAIVLLILVGVFILGGLAVGSFDIFASSWLLHGFSGSSNSSFLLGRTQDLSGDARPLAVVSI